MPLFVASLATAVLLEFNILAAVMAIDILSGRPLVPPLPGRGAEYAINGLYLLATYFLIDWAWVKDGKLLALESEFAERTPRRETMRTIGFWLYIILTVGIPIFLTIIAPSRHG